jgi:hypothetical protein
MLAVSFLSLLALTVYWGSWSVELPAYPVCFTSIFDLLDLPDSSSHAEVSEACSMEYWVNSDRYTNKTCHAELRDWFDGHVTEACKQFLASASFLRQPVSVCFSNTECTPDPRACSTVTRAAKQAYSTVDVIAIMTATFMGLYVGIVAFAVTAVGWILFKLADTLWAGACFLVSLPPSVMGWVVRTVPIMVAYLWTALVSLATATCLALQQMAVTLGAVCSALINLPYVILKWTTCAMATAFHWVTWTVTRTVLWTSEAAVYASMTLVAKACECLMICWYIVLINISMYVVSHAYSQMKDVCKRAYKWRQSMLLVNTFCNNAVMWYEQEILTCDGYLKFANNMNIEDDIDKRDRALLRWKGLGSLIVLYKNRHAVPYASPWKQLVVFNCSVLLAAIRFLIITGAWALLVYKTDHFIRLLLGA